MNKKLEFKVKIKSFRWKNYFLIIRENDFQLKKEKKKILLHLFIRKCSCI